MSDEASLPLLQICELANKWPALSALRDLAMSDLLKMNADAQTELDKRAAEKAKVDAEAKAKVDAKAKADADAQAKADAAAEAALAARNKATPAYVAPAQAGA